MQQALVHSLLCIDWNSYFLPLWPRLVTPEHHYHPHPNTRTHTNAQTYTHTHTHTKHTHCEKASHAFEIPVQVLFATSLSPWLWVCATRASSQFNISHVCSVNALYLHLAQQHGFKHRHLLTHTLELTQAEILLHILAHRYSEFGSVFFLTHTRTPTDTLHTEPPAVPQSCPCMFQHT